VRQDMIHSVTSATWHDHQHSKPDHRGQQQFCTDDVEEYGVIRILFDTAITCVLTEQKHTN